MFENILSIVGIGAARVDTVLTVPEVTRGQTLSGEVRMYGGKAAQTINGIDLELVTSYRLPYDHNRPGHEVVLWEHNLSERFTLGVGEEKVLPFSCLVPFSTPISQGPAKVWLKTSLDVTLAVDPKDQDPLSVGPDPATQHVLTAAESLGLAQTADSGVCIGVEGFQELTVVQGFVFRPAAPLEGALSGLKQLDILVMANGYDAEFQLEINRQDESLPRWQAESGPGHPPGPHRARFRLRHETGFGIDQLLSQLQPVLALH